MSLYRKRPVVINAIKWDCTQKTYEILTAMGMKFMSLSRDPAGVIYALRIETLEGTMTVYKDDFIIKGIKGEFYPCKPEIFQKTYEEVEI